MNPRVLLFSKYSRKGASSRLRSLQYLPELKKTGIEIEVSPLFDDTYLEHLYYYETRSRVAIVRAYLARLLKLLSCFRYDLIWIEYELFPYMPAWVERLLAALGVKYIVDYDDAIFHNYDLSENVLIKLLLSKKIDQVMANASCVLTGNDYLAQRATMAGAKAVEYLPTVVDSTRYHTNESQHIPLTIGWIGSPATQHYLIPLLNVFKRLSDECNYRLVLVGANASMRAALQGIPFELHAWSENTEAELVSSFDIGIMPLKDGPWEKGKCGYKLIQYMSCGLPVVASPVGVNVSIIEESDCGLLASEQDDWYAMLKTLLEDESKRTRLGRNGRASVESKFSLNSQAPNLVRIIREHV